MQSPAGGGGAAHLRLRPATGRMIISDLMDGRTQHSIHDFK